MFLLDILSLGPMIGLLCIISCINSACHNNDSDSESSTVTLRPKMAYSSKSMPKGEDERRCPICLSDYEEGDFVEFLDCLHFFHSDCVDQWLPLSHTCPVCRFPC
ncbi:hypothetical protein RND81_12G102200 [Saponaria officinalis]|uniref:RING-type domain-containing protein n=1 Tax=Saponaria officinalis TaxID=3572 RepID=A0AAW1H8S7_SAPOF